MPARIIVNADDLGLNETTNEAIFEGLQRGVITSATLLANGAAVQAAIQKLHFFPRCSFGVHLNLTEFEPLCEGSYADLASILNQNRSFNGNSIRQVTITPRMLRAVFREWCCQIEHVIRLGLEPSHLDGHHHVHTISQMLPVLAALRRRYKVNRVRISKNLYVDAERPAPSLLAKKKLYNLALRTVGFKTTRIFTDLTTFVRVCTVNPPLPTNIELMVHPGSDDAAEAQLLKDDWSSRLPYPASLVSYKEF